MHAEVLDHVVDRFDTADRVALNVQRRQQISFGQTREHRRRFLQRRAKRVEEHGAGHQVSLGEFGGAIE